MNDSSSGFQCVDVISRFSLSHRMKYSILVLYVYVWPLGVNESCPSYFKWEDSPLKKNNNNKKDVCFV